MTKKIIAWAGNAYFAAHMRNAGHQVFVMPRNVPFLTWDDIVSRCGSPPDLFVYGDMSVTPFLKQVESFPCLTVFYAIDTHIHSWYGRYAQAFDVCCVAMRDHMTGFSGHRLQKGQVFWLPLFSKDHDRRIAPETSPPFDLIFVGKNDPHITPGRFRLLKYLAEHVPLEVRQGSYPELYGQARLVLNISEHGDLNFRVFEALGCGACLVTPRVGHGLLELFRDGTDLFTYEMGDRDGLVRLIRDVLANEKRRRAVADSGLTLVNARHRAVHRSAELMEMLEGIDGGRLVASRLAETEAIRQEYLRLLYLHFAETEPSTERASMYLDFAGRGLAR
jgi:glycosyltransferase involved in cell wall biosynthesis